MQRTPPFSLEDWIVEPEFLLLSSGETSQRVEPKVMSVLVQLAAQSRHVVSKDEILRAVWPDTFVSEDALTRCISVLRHVFKDNPHQPRYIKTVSKVGYCLLVEARPLEAPASVFQQTIAVPEVEAVEALPATAAMPPTNSGRRGAVRVGGSAALLAAAGGVAFWMIHSIRASSAAAVISTFQLTTGAGEQTRPAVSPDGSKVAFVWAKEDGGQHIYVKGIGSESMVRLTGLMDEEFSPVWSPDGKRIAFLSSSANGLALYVTPLDGAKPEQKLYIPEETSRWEQGALAWSPDGKSLALADHMGAQPTAAILSIDIETMRSRVLTTPPAGWEGDMSPAFSPDGTKIAFLRASESAVADIDWIAADGGEVHALTHDGKMINGMTWSSDSQSVVFSSNRAGEYALWKAGLETGQPQRMPVGSEDATQPAISTSGKNLAFVQSSAIFGVMRVEAQKTGGRNAEEEPIVSSSAQDSAPNVSPDGAQFAFQSWRSGSQQIWVSSIDGQSLRQLTPAGGELSGSGSPAWSPNGDQVLFDSRLGGHSHIFMIGARGGTPKQLTFGEVNDIVPRWSADGQSIYFRSNRGGRWQLWKIPVATGAPQPVTSDDGMVGQESADGRWLYFARGGERGIWRMPRAGGEAVRILDQPAAGYWSYWAVSNKGIYFLDSTQKTPAISFYDAGTEKTSLYANLSRLPPLYLGLSLLPDGKGLLISDKHDAGSHISIARGAF